MLATAPPRPFAMTRRFLVAALLLVPLAGCVYSYHPPIQQGNALPWRILARLHRGMTEAQVVYLLGTPVLADPPHPHLWLYVYYYKAGALSRPVLRRLTVFFHHGRVVKILGPHGAVAARRVSAAKAE
jgi:outer membrane protein assembly factor BamE